MAFFGRTGAKPRYWKHFAVAAVAGVATFAFSRQGLPSSLHLCESVDGETGKREHALPRIDLPPKIDDASIPLPPPPLNMPSAHGSGSGSHDRPSDSIVLIPSSGDLAKESEHAEDHNDQDDVEEEEEEEETHKPIDDTPVVTPAAAKEYESEMLLVSGTGNIKLAEDISRHLNCELGKVNITSCADGEKCVSFGARVRGKDVYVIQPTCPPVNENLMELMLLVACLRRGGARKITAVVPYYGYARQDRRTGARTPLSAADVARLLESLGINRMVSVDLHCGQIQGFFGPSVPVDNIQGGLVAVDYFGKKHSPRLTIVSPDAGGVHRSKQFRESLEKKYDVRTTFAMISKERRKAGEVEQMNLVGNVAGRNCIIIDDMIDSAGTLSHSAKLLKQKGAESVCAFATHGLFSHPASINIVNSPLKEVVVTDTIPLNPDASGCKKIKQLHIGWLLAEVIQRIHFKKSMLNMDNFIGPR